MTDQSTSAARTQSAGDDEQNEFDATHEGTPARVRDEAPSQHMGADERQVTPNVPPMRGPGTARGGGSTGTPDDDDMDPQDEITPG